MHCLRLLFITLLLVCLSQGSAVSQNTGFGGKRFLFKTTAIDGIEGILTDGGVEVVVGKYWTLTAGFNWQSHERETNYPDGVILWEDGCIFDERVSKNTDVKHRSAYVAARIYGSGFRKDFVGAPHGWFGSVAFEAGVMKLDGYYHRGIEHNGIDEPEYNGPCTQEAAEVGYNSQYAFGTLRVGLGYQHFFTPRFSAGFLLNNTWSVRDGGNQFNEELYNGLSRSNINSNLVEATLDGEFGIGLAAKIEIGIMLF